MKLYPKEALRTYEPQYKDIPNMKIARLFKQSETFKQAECKTWPGLTEFNFFITYELGMLAEFADQEYVLDQTEVFNILNEGTDFSILQKDAYQPDDTITWQYCDPKSENVYEGIVQQTEDTHIVVKIGATHVFLTVGDENLEILP